MMNSLMLLTNDHYLQMIDAFVNYDQLAIKDSLSLEFIRSRPEKFNWSLLIAFQNLPYSFVREHEKWVNWEVLPLNQRISNEFLFEFSDKISMKSMSMRKLPYSYIRDHADLLDWEMLVLNSFIYREEFGHVAGRIEHNLVFYDEYMTSMILFFKLKMSKLSDVQMEMNESNFSFYAGMVWNWNVELYERDEDDEL